MSQKATARALILLMTMCFSAGEAYAYEKLPSALDREAVLGTYDLASKLLGGPDVEAARKVAPRTKREAPCPTPLPGASGRPGQPLPPAFEAAKTYCGFSSLITENAVCCGSISAAMRPISGMSMGGARRVAPIFFARSTVPSHSLTEK